VPTGSTTTTNTIGTVRVACSNGREGRSARTSQDCIRRKCGQFDRVLANASALVAAQRVSTRRLRPSVHPNAASPW
jgi:hypothetical protein